MEKFQRLPKCFQKSSAADASKCVCRWERVKNDQDAKKIHNNEVKEKDIKHFKKEIY